MQSPDVSMLAHLFLKQRVTQGIHLCRPRLASKLAIMTTELEGD